MILCLRVSFLSNQLLQIQNAKYFQGISLAWMHCCLSFLRLFYYSTWDVANHFCLQVFLSEQTLPSLSMSCSSARTLLQLLISFRVTLRVFSASRSCPLYWSLSSPELQLGARGVQIQIWYLSNIINFGNVLPYHLICR